MKKLLWIIAGAALTAIGLLGFFLPVLPGFALIFLGLSLIAPGLAGRWKRWAILKFLKRPEWLPFSEWRGQGARAGFTTRHFPLVAKTTDDLLESSRQDSLKEFFSKRIFRGARRFVFLNQVHGGHVAVWTEEEIRFQNDFVCLAETDGVLTAARGVVLLVLSADCLPVFLFAPGRKGKPSWIGLVHAGWKGAREGMAGKAFRLISEKSGVPLSGIQIGLGPRIDAAHYEVGGEFKNFFSKKSLRMKRGRLYFNLAREIKRQLLVAGARPANFLDSHLGTVTHNTHFYSFRKERDAAGRIISFIMLV